MNLLEIEQLVELVQKANISELTLRHDGARITIRKTPEGPTVQGGDLMPYMGESEDNLAYDLRQDSDDISSNAPAEPEAISIFSPLVGHFRHIKPMVGLGAHVAKGQVVGVIESVKLINDITSPNAGQITDVLVDDGQAVEYGQELFTICPQY